MDIEKLIRRLRNDADAYRNGKTLGRAFADQEDVLDNAATAISTLQAENEKLRAKLTKAHEKADVRVKTNAKLIEKNSILINELEQVKRERDAAVSDLTFVVNQYRLETTGIDLCGLCEYDLPPVGENGQTAECPGFYVNDCFKWRGPEEG